MKKQADRIDEIEESFASADEDADGQISLTEFRGLMLELDRHMHDSSVATSFLAIDSNHDGRITFAEFRAWWLRG
jgi:Ca2+-binding EF-hand superfamily protein